MIPSAFFTKQKRTPLSICGWVELSSFLFPFYFNSLIRHSLAELVNQGTSVTRSFSDSWWNGTRIFAPQRKTDRSRSSVPALPPTLPHHSHYWEKGRKKESRGGCLTTLYIPREARKRKFNNLVTRFCAGDPLLLSEWLAVSPRAGENKAPRAHLTWGA